MISQEKGKIPAETLDKFEWLAREAFWATTKSPFLTQWKRWLAYPDTEHTQANSGLVIGNNLSRAKGDIRHAAEYEGSDRTILLSRAATGIGKMASGLIAMAAHFNTPPSQWRAPLASHLPKVLLAADETIRHAQTKTTVSLDSEYYYEQFEPVSASIRAMRGRPDANILTEQAERVMGVAAIATKTWSDFMINHEGLLLDQGATPRSAGPLIDNLYTDFEQYIPLIHQAAVERHGKA
jgi:hypothetical protein